MYHVFNVYFLALISIFSDIIHLHKIKYRNKEIIDLWRLCSMAPVCKEFASKYFLLRDNKFSFFTFLDVLQFIDRIQVHSAARIERPVGGNAVTTVE